MKLLAEDGYLRPKLRVALFLILAVFSAVTGILQLTSKSALDTIFGTLSIIGVPGGLYFSWYGYRKMKRSEPEKKWAK